MTDCPKCGCADIYPIACGGTGLKLTTYYCEDCDLYWTHSEEQHRFKHQKISSFRTCERCDCLNLEPDTCASRGKNCWRLDPRPWKGLEKKT